MKPDVYSAGVNSQLSHNMSTQLRFIYTSIPYGMVSLYGMVSFSAQLGKSNNYRPRGHFGTYIIIFKVRAHVVLELYIYIYFFNFFLNFKKINSLITYLEITIQDYSYNL